MTTVNGSGVFRIIHETATERHVSEPLTLIDVAGYLEVEEMLHRAGGWLTERHGAMLRCEREGRVRWIWPREERET